jgi:hypothetical protein
MSENQGLSSLVLLGQERLFRQVPGVGDGIFDLSEHLNGMFRLALSVHFSVV